LPISAFALWKYVSAPASTPAAVTSGADSSLGVLEIVFTGGVQVFINDQYAEPLQLNRSSLHQTFTICAM
jgi:hypothetical protein